MRILLTGASGFIGQAVRARLLADGEHQLRCALRQPSPEAGSGCEVCVAPPLGPEADWREAVQGMDAVIHCAARVHVMQEQETDPLAAFRYTNVEGTLRLARQAVQAGVRRFIYLSSVKVNGEETTQGRVYHADDVAAPQDPYGISKFEAEAGLLDIAAKTALEVVIVRPPLVYGPGVKANFLTLLRWLHKGVPLPFGAIDNRRSLVALDNLVDFLVVCLKSSAAVNQCFLVSDGDDLSTTDLLRRLSIALGRPARLLPLPQGWLEAGARLLHREDLSRRLCGSLQVDIAKNRELLGWVPPFTVEQAFANTAAHFLETLDQ